MVAGARPMLLWYVWIRLVDGAWHKVDEIAGQLRIPKSAVSWAAKFLSEHGLAEYGDEEDEVRRLSNTGSRFEDIVRNTIPSPRIK